MDDPILWQFTASHFNEKARWALDWKAVRHVRRSLLPGPHAVTIRQLTGQTATPVLRLNGATIHDSSRIIAALEAAFPEPPLYPADDASRRRALELEEFFDEELGPHIRRAAFHHLLARSDLMAPLFSHDAGPLVRAIYRACFPVVGAIVRRALRIDAETAEGSRLRTLAALDRLEAEIGPSGYLVGDRFTVADLTAAALFSPLVAPPEFPYPLPDAVPRPLAEFRESVSDRAGFRWVLDVYRRHRGTSAAASS